MPFKMDNDQLVPTYFRVTVATTGFATGAATSGGGVTPNPSKAPWYFLGLQEMLVYPYG